ncbi:hypothetical protein [Acidaminococcus massiliensis]|uniref:hypothetical protein n=1 Tax=Acidaminococcus massiliensis TaxID=1852375 RepID=UPI002057C8E6|nr:MAG TPA: baseplate wedge protein [Caudoviricetes sp.]
MIYRRLSKDWDYTFGNGTSNYIKGAEAVAQAIKSRLLLLYGEWWEDQEDGLPLWQKILGSSGRPENQQAVDLIIRDRISETEGVLAITAWTSSFENRNYVFQALVETKFGALSVSNEEVRAA